MLYLFAPPFTLYDSYMEGGGSKRIIVSYIFGVPLVFGKPRGQGYHDTTRLKFTALPIYRIYLCPDTAKFTTLPIYPIYHGLKNGEIYKFTDLPNLPHETEVKPQIGEFMFCSKTVKV